MLEDIERKIKRSLESKNEVLEDRLEAIYDVHLLDEKFWYNTKNQKLFLDSNKNIKKRIAQENKNNK